MTNLKELLEQQLQDFDNCDKEEIKEALFAMMEAIKDLKEKECENSGWNWREKIGSLIDKI